MTETHPATSPVEVVSCPVCGSEHQVHARMRVPRDRLATELGLDHSRSSWVVCRSCGMVFQSPRPRQDVVDALYAKGGYHQDRGGVPEHYIQYSLRRSVPALSWFIDQVGATPGRAFDVGCGVGGALVYLRSLGWEAGGIEPDPLLSGVARSRFALDVSTGYFDARHSFDPVDLVYSCHVWEHLQDPHDAAAASYALLRERDGYLFIVVPTFRQSRTNAWKCFNSSHTLMFTHVSLSNVLEQAGFEVVTHRYVADADSELWLVARACAEPSPPSLTVEPVGRVQREILTAPLKAPLGLPARLRKHFLTARSNPGDFLTRAGRSISARGRSLLRRK